MSDSASLSGATSTAGGTVAYRYFSGGSCSGVVTQVGSPVTVTNGVVPTSSVQTFSTAGSYSWDAVYSGDSSNNGATSACEPLGVVQPGLSLSTSDGMAGLTITISGTSFAPSSTVTVLYGGNQVTTSPSLVVTGGGGTFGCQIVVPAGTASIGGISTVISASDTFGDVASSNFEQITYAPLQALLGEYWGRADLQAAFPEVRSGDYSGITAWAYNVASQQFVDSSYSTLYPFSPYYYLMSVYVGRSDLLGSFPSSFTIANSYFSLVNWAGGVVTGSYQDSARSLLSPYGYWYTLMGIYNGRGDLQSAFPNAYLSSPSFISLVNWAGNVVIQEYTDSSLPLLQHYGYWYELASTYNSRQDLLSAYPNAYSNFGTFVNLVDWAGGVVTNQFSDGSYGSLHPFGYWYDLMSVYSVRPDLQGAFPQAFQNGYSFSNLVCWAKNVVTGAYSDSSASLLSPYASWYEANC